MVFKKWRRVLFFVFVVIIIVLHIYAIAEYRGPVPPVVWSHRLRVWEGHICVLPPIFLRWAHMDKVQDYMHHVCLAFLFVCPSCEFPTPDLVLFHFLWIFFCLFVCLLSLDMVSLSFHAFLIRMMTLLPWWSRWVFFLNKKFVRGLLEPLNMTGWLHFVMPTSWITAWSWAACEAGSHGKTDIYQLGTLASDSAFPASSVAWRKLSGSSTELPPNTQHCVSNVTVPWRAFIFFPTRLWIACITDHGLICTPTRFFS